VVAWLEDMGYYRKTIEEFAYADASRFRVNHYVTDVTADATSTCGLRPRRHAPLRATLGIEAHCGQRAPVSVRPAGQPRRRRRGVDSIKDSIDGWIDTAGPSPAEARYVPAWEPRTHRST